MTNVVKKLCPRHSVHDLKTPRNCVQDTKLSHSEKLWSHCHEADLAGGSTDANTGVAIGQSPAIELCSHFSVYLPTLEKVQTKWQPLLVSSWVTWQHLTMLGNCVLGERTLDRDLCLGRSLFAGSICNFAPEGKIAFSPSSPPPLKKKKMGASRWFHSLILQVMKQQQREEPKNWLTRLVLNLFHPRRGVCPIRVDLLPEDIRILVTAGETTW